MVLLTGAMTFPVVVGSGVRAIGVSEISEWKLDVQVLIEWASNR